MVGLLVFFYADGTIGYYFKGNNNQPQLTLSVTNKLYFDVVHFVYYFGGAIYFDKAQNGYYKWSIQSEANFSAFLSILKFVHLNLLNEPVYFW